MKLIIKWLTAAISILIISHIIPGVVVAGIWSALIIAVVLGFLNAVIKPLIILLTLPINVLTLGLFTFVINAAMVLLASSIVKGFYIGGFWNALLFSLLLMLMQEIFEAIFKD